MNRQPSSSGAKIPHLPTMAERLGAALGDDLPPPLAMPIPSVVPSPAPVGPEEFLSVEELLAKASEVAGDPERFVCYENDPDGFIKDILGVELWDKQLEVIRELIDKPRVAVRSGHGVGKSFVVSCAVLWWLYARKGLVITTAPTWNHVEGVLWREINSIAFKSLVPLPGQAYQTERRINNQWYAMGLSTNTPSAFQGIHHPRLLVVLDEAPGVNEQVHLEIRTLATDPQNCILMIGNPTITSGSFYDAFRHPEIWTLQHISCLDHPNVKERKQLIPGAVSWQWVEEARGTWGEGHPFWYSRVLGDFPLTSNRGTIPMWLVERAMSSPEKWEDAKRKAALERHPLVFGLDVARYGQNKCVLVIRHGDAVLDVLTWGHTSTMETVGKVIALFREYSPSTVVVDEAGVGGGVVDRLMEEGFPIIGYNGGHKAFTPGYFSNRRSELWWHLRTRLEHERLWLPNHKLLFGELIAPEYIHTSSGRLKVETKEDLLRRQVASPDHADALVMAFATETSAEAFISQEPEDAKDPWATPEGEPEFSLETPFDQLPAGF